MVVHVRKAPYEVFVGRPSVFGNPFIIGRDGDRSQVIQKYRQWLLAQPELVKRVKTELRGKVLGCFCAPEPCHADVLVEVSNAD